MGLRSIREGRWNNLATSAWHHQLGIADRKQTLFRCAALVCVDCDDAEATALAQERCPPTPAMQTTAGGGLHLLYRRSDVPYIGQTLGLRYKGRTWKLDIKADHNYIMAPGSRRDDGRVYQWHEPWTLEMLQALPIFEPSWLPHEQTKTTHIYSPLDDHDDITTDYDLPTTLRQEQAENYLDHCPGSTQGRGADNYCFALAMTLALGLSASRRDRI